MRYVGGTITQKQLNINNGNKLNINIDSDSDSDSKDSISPSNFVNDSPTTYNSNYNKYTTESNSRRTVTAKPNTSSYSEIPYTWAPNFFRDSLRVGKTYRILYRIVYNRFGNRFTDTKPTNMVLEEIHEHVATFRHPKGWLESWDYWELKNIMVPAKR